MFGKCLAEGFSNNACKICKWLQFFLALRESNYESNHRNMFCMDQRRPNPVAVTYCEVWGDSGSKKMPSYFPTLMAAIDKRNS
jgi:hypothetical protein